MIDDEEETPYHLPLAQDFLALYRDGVYSYCGRTPDRQPSKL